MPKFEIGLDDKPHLYELYKKEGKKEFAQIVGTFVSLMETAAEKNWLELPKVIHSSISFKEVVTGILNAVMTTSEINPSYYDAMQSDLHPLSFLSDQRKDFVTSEPEEYDWRSHFSLDSKEVNQETLEKIIRKMLYLLRWIDIDTVSKALLTSQFVDIESKDAKNLPFQPALQYQKKQISELHAGKFLHDVGLFDCGTIDQYTEDCPACKIGELEDVYNYRGCRRCNAGFKVEEV